MRKFTKIVLPVIRYVSVYIAMVIAMVIAMSCLPLPPDGVPPPQPVPHIPNYYHSPSFNNTGNRILYYFSTDESFDYDVPEDADGIWMMNLDGTNRRLVREGKLNYDSTPLMSTDGEWILYCVSGLNSSIVKFKVNVDLTVTIPVEGKVNDVSWSPDGMLILYSSTYGTEEKGIYRPWFMLSDGTMKSRIDWQREGQSYRLPDNCRYPVWSDSGRHIAFYHSQKGIAEVSLNGEEYSVLLQPSLPTYPQNLRFSPDYTELLFYNGQYLHKWTRETNEVVELVDTWGEANWSPDGTKLVYIHQDEQEYPTIWIVDSDGKNAHPMQ